MEAPFSLVRPLIVIFTISYFQVSEIMKKNLT